MRVGTGAVKRGDGEVAERDVVLVVRVGMDELECIEQRDGKCTVVLFFLLVTHGVLELILHLLEERHPALFTEL